LPQNGFANTNTFTQFVATCDSVGGFIGLYANGVLIGSNSYQPPIVSGTAYSLFIGHRPLTGNPNPFAGELDDIRIYNRALSAAEAHQLYLAEAGPFVNLLKAVKPSFSNLTLTTNYQLQVSADLNTW